MFITKCICDRCGKEIPGDRYSISVYRYTEDKCNVMDVPELNHADFCGNCINDLIILITGKPVLEPESEKPEDVPEPAKLEDIQEPIRVDPKPKKVIYLNKGLKEEVARRYAAGETSTEIASTMNLYLSTVEKEIKAIKNMTEPEITRLDQEHKDEITRRYRNGEEMEKIAEDMHASLPAVSRFIADAGLGKERYGNRAPQ